LSPILHSQIELLYPQMAHATHTLSHSFISLNTQLLSTLEDFDFGTHSSEQTNLGKPALKYINIDLLIHALFTGTIFLF